MAKRLKMATVQSILSLHAQGWSGRRIARELHVNRETVSRYVRLAQPPAQPDPVGPDPANAPIGAQVVADRSDPAKAPISGPGVPGVRTRPRTGCSSRAKRAWPLQHPLSSSEFLGIVA